MSRTTTLTRRFGTHYAFVLAILVGVCGVVFVHLERMRTDTERLMEESRENAVTVRVLSALTSLRGLVERADRSPEEDLPVREALNAVLLDLADLEEPVGDPSREEHQFAEDKISHRLRKDLARIDDILAEVASPPQGSELFTLLDRTSHYAGVLRAETEEESREAREDLDHRVRTTRLVMLGVLLAALVLLGLALLLVHRAVVRPIKRLRDGAERFGSGQLDHRMRVESDDEMGSLANAFNSMADRIAASQKDLEERVQTRTNEFLRAARLADLGILASGIAHEINTPLASIASCAEGLERRLEKGELSPELLKEYASTISSEAFRARDITTRMLALVRQEPGKVADVSLELVLERAVGALRHRADHHGVKIDCAQPVEDVTLRVNAGELVQILVNLIANAIDASPRGARVAVRHEIDGNLLALEVADQGEGIAEDSIERVFEPFYTTKRPGEGTGLGLPLVNALVDSHLGRISVHSEAGQGSVFRVVLPMDWGGE